MGAARLVVTFDVALADRDALRRLAEVVAGPLGEALAAGDLATTWFLDADALACDPLIRALVATPRLETGLLVRAVPAGARPAALALAAALHRRAGGRRAVVHRGAPADLDATLGPALLDAGLVVDMSARPFTAAAHGLPVTAWRSDGRGDLTRPGCGPVLEIPVSVRAPFAAGRDAARRPSVWDLADAGGPDRLGDLLEGAGGPDIVRVHATATDAAALLDPATRERVLAQLGRVRHAFEHGEVVAATAAEVLALVPGASPVAAPDLPPASRLLLVDPGETELATARARGPARIEMIGGAAEAARALGALRVSGALEEAAVRGGRVHDVALVGAARPDVPIEDRLAALRAVLGEGARARVALGGVLRGRTGDAARRALDAVAAAAGFELLGLEDDAVHLRVRERPPRRRRPERDPEEGISFCIISGGARPDMLARVVGAIAGQDLARHEIVVAGIDEARPGVRLVALPEAAREGRLGALRNAAVSAARFERICILDDDVLLTPGWGRALTRRIDDFDLLTSQLRVPDGGRYWDHATVGGPRGHVLLEPHEHDDFLYPTGGGAWVMARRVAERVSWNDDLAFYEGEDVAFARAVTAGGFAIAHERAMVAVHADARYTSVGRRCLARPKGVAASWATAALRGRTPTFALETALRLRDQERLAEAADAVRVGLRAVPGHGGLLAEWGRMLQEAGGDLRGVGFYPGGAPYFRDVLTFADAHRARGIGAPA